MTRREGMSMGWGGKLLVASTLLDEPTFRRTVILLLEHGDEGAMGVVVNRPSPARVDAVLPPWEAVVSAPATLFHGGPVSTDSALALARVEGTGALPAGLYSIGTQIALVNLDSEPQEVAHRTVGLRIFHGYAGWSAGQLEGEIREGSWHLVDSLPGDAFSGHPQRLWQEVLARQGGDLALLASYPDDPSLN